MGMIKMSIDGKLPPQWVQISEFFGSREKGSKLSGSARFYKNFEQKKQAVSIISKIANAGLIPALDILSPFEEAKRGVLVVDIDSLAVPKIPNTLENRAFNVIDVISVIGKTQEERFALLQEVE